ncbi:hypothetical protein Trydic_g3665 [Trypoxylus dichotomus]
MDRKKNIDIREEFGVRGDRIGENTWKKFDRTSTKEMGRPKLKVITASKSHTCKFVRTQILREFAPYAAKLKAKIYNPPPLQKAYAVTKACNINVHTKRTFEDRNSAFTSKERRYRNSWGLIKPWRFARSTVEYKTPPDLDVWMDV